MSAAVTAETSTPVVRLPRRRLMGILDRWLPLTVVRGPSGYGKSTLVRQWATEAESAGIRVLWCNAIGTADLCTAILSTLAGGTRRVVGRAQADSFAACVEAQRLIDRYDGQTVLIVDGLDDMTRGDLIGQLLELCRLRSAFRVIVTTRVRDAAEELAALTLGVQVIAPHDLQFCQTEIADLAAARSLALTSVQAELVRKEVGGCPILVDAVLGWLAQSTRIDATSIAGAATVAHEGLWSHVLHRSLSPTDVDTLAELSTAAGWLTADAARFLTEEADVEQRLVHLESVGALTSELGPDGTPLFRIPPAVGRIARAHATTAIDVAAKGAALARHLAAAQPERAVRQAYALRDWTLLGEIFEQSWLDLWSSEDPIVLRALAEMPGDALRALPRTAAAQAIVTGARRTPADLQFPVTRSPAELHQIAHFIGMSAALQTSVLEAMALRRSGRFPDALAIAMTVANVVEVGGEAVPPAALQIEAWGRYELALTALLAGDTALSSEQLQAAVQSLPWASPKLTHLREMVHGLSALKAAMRGDLLAVDVRAARARETEGIAPDYLLFHHDQGTAATIAEAITSIDRLDRTTSTAALNALRTGDQGGELWAFSAWAQARFSLHWGDRRGALRDLCDARRLHRQVSDGGGLAHPLLVAAEADLLLADQRANRAAALLANAPTHPFVGVARARFALTVGDYDNAILESLAIIAEDNRLDRLRLDALLIHAVGVTKTKGVEHAMPSWREALATASRLGSPLAPFALLPPGLLAPVESQLPELRAMTRPARERGGGLPDCVEVIELSPRQQSVLDALARGMPIPAIARSQFVSQNTIKSQLRSLYSKLGVHSREEAVALARDAGLIEN